MVKRQLVGRHDNTGTKPAEIAQALADLDPSSWQDGSTTSRTSIVLPSALLEDIRQVAGNDTIQAALATVLGTEVDLGATNSVSGVVRAATAAALTEVRDELLAIAYAASADSTSTEGLYTDESLAHA